MYRLKSNRDGTFSLVYSSPPIVLLKHIRITFPEITSHSGGKPHLVPGAAEITIKIEHEDGNTEEINNVPMEW